MDYNTVLLLIHDGVCASSALGSVYIIVSILRKHQKSATTLSGRIVLRIALSNLFWAIVFVPLAHVRRSWAVSEAAKEEKDGASSSYSINTPWDGLSRRTSISLTNVLMALAVASCLWVAALGHHVLIVVPSTSSARLLTDNELKSHELLYSILAWGGAALYLGVALGVLFLSDFDWSVTWAAHCIILIVVVYTTTVLVRLHHRDSARTRGVIIRLRAYFLALIICWGPYSVLTVYAEVNNSLITADTGMSGYTRPADKTTAFILTIIAASIGIVDGFFYGLSRPCIQRVQQHVCCYSYRESVDTFIQESGLPAVAPSPFSQDLESVICTLTGFNLVAEIGKGGSGIVYLAEWRGSKVAAKRLFFEGGTSFLSSSDKSSKASQPPHSKINLCDSTATGLKDVDRTAGSSSDVSSGSNESRNPSQKTDERGSGTRLKPLYSSADISRKPESTWFYRKRRRSSLPLAPTELTKDFYREADILAGLRHPNIVYFMACGFFEGCWWIVSEFCPNGSLRDLLVRGGSPMMDGDMWEKTKIRLALGAARGLQFLHEAKPSLIHRDVKSLNILVDDSWNAKLADFGTAKFIDIGNDWKRRTSSLRSSTSSSKGGAVPQRTTAHGLAMDLYAVTPSFHSRDSIPLSAENSILAGKNSPSTGNGVVTHNPTLSSEISTRKNSGSNSGYNTSFVGSARWSAPEILRGERNYNSAIDIYSFGIVLWEMVTRQLPYEHLKFTKDIEDAVVSNLRPVIPPGSCSKQWQQLIERCWAPEALDRPTTREVVQKLTEIAKQHRLSDTYFLRTHEMLLNRKSTQSNRLSTNTQGPDLSAHEGIDSIPSVRRKILTKHSTKAADNKLNPKSRRAGGELGEGLEADSEMGEEIALGSTPSGVLKEGDEDTHESDTSAPSHPTPLSRAEQETHS